MKCSAFTCGKDKPTIEKLASHVRRMSFDMNESQHILWLDKYNLKSNVKDIEKKLRELYPNED